MRRSWAALCLALLSSTAWAQNAAPQYTSLWSLGDSLTDVGRTGNLIYSTSPKGPLYYDKHFSNGKVWVEYLSDVNGIPYVRRRNLAWGGSVTGSFNNKLYAAALLSLEQQTRQFKEGVTGNEFNAFDYWTSGKWTEEITRQPDASYGTRPLITLTIGGNNFRQYVEDGGIQDFFRLKNSLSDEIATILKNVPADISAMQTVLRSRPNIAQDGATFYVWTVPDVSTTPKFIDESAQLKFELKTGVKEVNLGLKKALYALGDQFSAGNGKDRIVVVDAAAFLSEVQKNPAPFGFTYTKENCISSETGKYTNGCSASNVDQYLFWDEFHPTTKAHEMIAQYARDTDFLEYGAPVTLTLPYVANINVRDQAFDGPISGTGTMIKQGRFTLALTGSNTYTGGTRVDLGLVRIASDDNLGARSGLLTLQGGGIRATQSLTMQRDIRVGNSVSGQEEGGSRFGGTFIVDPNAVLTLQNNMLTGSGDILKGGAGTLDLRSRVLNSRSLTQIDDGVLKINSADKYVSYKVVVGADGVLGGSGTIVGTVVNMGRLAPGNSIGTLTIEGDLLQEDSGSYQLEVDATRTDNLIVTGTLRLDGDIHVITDPTDKITTQSFTVARASGNVEGQYDEVVDLSPFLSETMHYGTNTVSMSFTRNFAAPATTANQRAVAAHLNGAYMTTSQGDLDNVFFGLDTTGTNAAGANALDQLSGVSIGNLLTASAIQQGQFTRALEDRISARRAGRDAASVTAGGALSFAGSDVSGLGSTLAYASAALQDGGTAGMGAMNEPDGVSAWARVLGGPASIGGAGSFDMTGVGVMLGLDKSFGGGLAGLSFAYGSLNTQGVNAANGGADTYQISLYGSLQSGNLFLDGTASYSYADYSSTRALAFGALQRVATASPDGNAVALSVKAGGVWSTGDLTFEPSLGFDWYHLTRNAFVETGAGAAGLNVGSQTLDLVLPSIGVRMSRLFNAGTFTLTPELSARYYYNAGDTSVGTTAGLISAPGVPFSVTGTGLGRNIGVLAAGLAAQQTQNLKISAQYELQVADDLTAQSVSLGLRYTW